jgi:hypothetical protein
VTGPLWCGVVRFACSAPFLLPARRRGCRTYCLKRPLRPASFKVVLKSARFYRWIRPFFSDGSNRGATHLGKSRSMSSERGAPQRRLRSSCTQRPKLKLAAVGSAVFTFGRSAGSSLPVRVLPGVPGGDKTALIRCLDRLGGVAVLEPFRERPAGPKHTRAEQEES